MSIINNKGSFKFDKKVVIFLLFLILSFGFIVRIYKLDQVPAGFFADEAAIGYNAYKVLTTGGDEYGIPFPFFFRSFGSYRLPTPIYSNIPFVALFGLSAFSVRLTAAFFGTLTILVIFLLTKKLFENNFIAFLSALFVAISPWHIHFSRFGSEYIYFPFWFSLGVYFFIIGIRNKYLLVLSSLILGISIYTYYPSLFIVPIFYILLFIIYFNQIKNNKYFLVISIFIFIFTIIPLIIGVGNETLLTRWVYVSAFKENDSSLFFTIFKKYIEHFSLDFLFLKGDIDYPGHFITRFSVRGMGELYRFQLPLLILGIFSVFYFKKYYKSLLVLLIWFLFYPLGSSLTQADGGGPFAFRSIFGVIPFQILSALGIVFLFSLFKNKLIKYILIIILLLTITVSFKNYLHRYFVEYPLYSSDFWGWQFGARDSMNYFLSNNSSYDELYLMGQFNAPEIFIKFYDPLNNCKGKCKIGDISNLNTAKKQLFSISSDRLSEVPSFLEVAPIKILYYPNQNVAYTIGEIHKK